MTACFICAIVEMQSPARIFYQDDTVIAFEPLELESRVHVLIAPKRHIPSADALEEGDYILWMRLLQVARNLARNHGIDIDAEGYHLGTNCGRHSIRAFAHLHIWLMNGAEGQ
ncbi:MAG: histidine triad nucleotide-binding protein [Chloroflexota bacterium]